MSDPSWADELHFESEDGPTDRERLLYANVDEFVRSYLLANWRRNTLHANWCSKRLGARLGDHPPRGTVGILGRQRLEPGTGMATWWRDFADHHMRVLTDREAGPFFKCDVTKGRHEVRALRETELPPEGIFRNGNEET